MVRFLGFCALLLMGCISDDPNDPRSIANHQYVNVRTGVSMRFPSDWRLSLDTRYSGNSMDLVAWDPTPPILKPEISVFNSPHYGVTDLELILNEIRDEVQAKEPNLDQFEGAVKTLGGRSFIELNFFTVSSGESLKIRQHLIYNHGVDITVTYTDLASRFDTNSVFDSVSQSLKIE